MYTSNDADGAMDSKLAGTLLNSIDDRFAHHAEIVLQGVTERLERHLCAVEELLGQERQPKAGLPPFTESDKAVLGGQEARGPTTMWPSLTQKAAKDADASDNYQSGSQTLSENAVDTRECSSVFENIGRRLRGSSSPSARRAGRFVDRLSRLWEVQEPEREGWLAHFVDSRLFEVMSAIVVMVNAGFLVYTTNKSVKTLEDDLSTFTLAFELAFAVYYTVELALRIWVHRLFFFWCDDFSWNMLDFALAMLAISDQILSFVAVGTGGGLNLTFMRSLRVLKMGKVLRVARLMRIFHELRLMLNSVLGSVMSLTSSFILLSFFFYIFSLIFVQSAIQHLDLGRDTMTEQEKDDLLSWFGSVEQAMLTLYMVSTGGEDWNAVFQIISDTGIVGAVGFIFYIGFFEIAIMNILTALFVESAMKLAQPDVEQLALERRKRDAHDMSELKRICANLDKDGDGEITWSEFNNLVENPRVKGHLATLGLDVRDAKNFFGILASYEPIITLDAFVAGCVRLKGTATSIDLQSLACETKIMHRKQEQFYENMRRFMT